MLSSQLHTISPETVQAPVITSQTSVYPALLSQVAQKFRILCQLGTNTKDLLEYNDCFTGRDCVGLLVSILGVRDRNVGILVGRALESQGFFHDVIWTSKLRDSPNELYAFGDGTVALPTGIFTLMADCYSTTCSKDQPCYSVICPRRFDEKLLPTTVTPATSYVKRVEKPSELWSTSVSKETLELVSKKEVGRQEVIFEIISTEREFCNDLENVIKHYIEPLRTRNILPEDKRDEFIKSVFSNITELHAINSRLCKKLLDRQKESDIVDRVGDIFVNITHDFYPYIEYGAQQVYAKSILDETRQNNPELQKFLKETEKITEFRKLPIESFLASATTRMGRYPLLLKPVMEKAVENHPDRSLIPQALADLKNILQNINVEAGKADNLLRLSKLQKKLVGLDEDEDVLKLNEHGRQIIREGRLILKRNNDTEMHVFLFDHAILITKKKELFLKDKSPAFVPLTTGPADTSKLFAMNFSVPARYGGPFSLFTVTHSERVSWLEAIEKQKSHNAENKKRFEITSLVNTFFPTTNPINCCCTYLNQLIIGTDSGLYIGQSDQGGHGGETAYHQFVKVIDLERIYQVDVIPKIDLMLVLADKILLSYPLRAVLGSAEGNTLERFRPRKIGNSVNFFRQGVSSNKTLVCTVKSAGLSSTIKVFEPMGLGVSNLHGKIGKMFGNFSDGLRPDKDLYIPSETKSLHYLTSKLCVGCARGFELVDLETLATQALLDPSDPSLEFVLRRETVRPMAIFRVKDGSFLLCYNEFGFYIDKFGRRTKGSWIMHWSGSPLSFSYMHPYIVAYEPTFIEIRNVDTGVLQQVIHTPNLRVLSVDPSMTDCVIDTPGSTFQHVFKLKQLHSELV